MGKKIARGFGYFFCGVLIVLCIVLIVAAAAFSASDTVDAFGFNIFIVGTEQIPTAPEGSAVFVKRCAPYEVGEGKLLLYTKGEDKKPALGYSKEYHAEDGVYFITVFENGEDIKISESDLVGTADYSSQIFGAIISFIKTPFGVFCIAVMPCIALILYDIIKALAAKMPPPEVIPQVKNTPEEKEHPSGISIASDGKGTYSRSKAGKSASAADEVLFSYAAKQKKSAPKQNERPIIPLTNRNDKPAPKASSEQKTFTKNDMDYGISISKRSEIAKTPAGVAVGRYAEAAKISEPLPEKTENISLSPSKETGDAFFSQSKIPQISKLSPKKSKEKEVSDDDEADNERAAAGHTARISAKRSTQIIANKRVEDLMSDDDDFRESRDRNRYEIDDILSGLNRRE